MESKCYELQLQFSLNGFWFILNSLSAWRACCQWEYPGKCSRNTEWNKHPHTYRVPTVVACPALSFNNILHALTFSCGEMSLFPWIWAGLWVLWPIKGARINRWESWQGQLGPRAIERNVQHEACEGCCFWPCGPASSASGLHCLAPTHTKRQDCPLSPASGTGQQNLSVINRWLFYALNFDSLLHSNRWP